MSRPVPHIPSLSEHRTPAQRWRIMWNWLFSFYLVVGALLLYNLADRFVFYYAETYTKISLWSMFLLWPFVVYLMLRRGNRAERARSEPISWQRNLVAMPLTAALIVGVFFAAPLGWLFAGAIWHGGSVHHVSATAVEVENYARRKGCNQSATLELLSVHKKTCLDHLYPPSTMRERQLFDVGVLLFPFGFFISSIANGDPALLAGKRVNKNQRESVAMSNSYRLGN